MLKLPIRKPDIKRATPTILSCLAAIGVVGTFISTRRAARKEEQIAEEDKMTRAKCYILPSLIGTGTIICIFSANALNRRQQANILSAYTLLQTAFNDYKSAVNDIYGEEGNQKVMERIVTEKFNPDSIIYAPGLTSVISLGIPDSDISEVVRTFYDPHSNRYFESTLSRVIDAEYNLNRNFMLGGGVTVDTFYDFLGLDPLKTDVPIGWEIEDGLYWIDFNHHLAILDDGMEVIVIEMVFEPGAVDIY